MKRFIWKHIYIKTILYFFRWYLSDHKACTYNLYTPCIYRKKILITSAHSSLHRGRAMWKWYAWWIARRSSHRDNKISHFSLLYTHLSFSPLCSSSTWYTLLLLRRETITFFCYIEWIHLSHAWTVDVHRASLASSLIDEKWFLFFCLQKQLD